MVRVGIPKALLYYQYYAAWKAFSGAGSRNSAQWGNVATVGKIV